MNKEETVAYQPKTLYEIEIADLQPDPNQPRKHFDKASLKSLAASIKDKGVLQPVLFKEAEGKLILVAGERRHKAAQEAGLKSIPAIMVEGGDTEELSLVENLQRENLNPIEEAEAVSRLKDEKNYTVEVIGALLGKGKSTISEMLSLIKLPDDIKNECRNSKDWSRARLLEIAKQPDEKSMLKLFNKAKKKGLTGDQLKQLKRKNYGKRKPSYKLALDSVGSSIKKLNRLDPDKFDQDQRSDVLSEIENLIHQAEELRRKFGAPNNRG